MPFRTGRAVVLVAAAALGLSACRRPPPEAPAKPAAAPAPAATAAPPPAAPKPLDRAGVIAATRLAADAYAAGAAYPAAAADLVGAPFEIRQPFGCAGAAPDVSVGYRVDPKRKTLVLQARPEVWTKTPWVLSLVGPQEVEAIEGFWLRRPWLTGDACPAIRAGASGAAPPAPSPETLGLARVFAPGGSRILRHGERGYEAVRKAEPGVLKLQGFRLVLAGRIGDFGDRQPIRCRSDGPEQRPVCLVAVEFDRVTFEDPVSGEVLAEWRS